MRFRRGAARHRLKRPRHNRRCVLRREAAPAHDLPAFDIWLFPYAQAFSMRQDACLTLACLCHGRALDFCRDAALGHASLCMARKARTAP